MCRRSRWRAPTAANTPRTTSTSRRICQRRITRPSSRPNCWSARPGLRYRVYRPAVVVGDSRTGEMDKVDGPYYFFGILAKLARLPRFTPIVLPDTGRTNIVPVDYVVDAAVRTDARPGPRRTDLPPHRTENHWPARHLPRHRTGGRVAAAARVAAASAATPFLRATGRAKVLRNMAATQLGHSRRDPRRRRPVARRSPPTTRGSVARHRDSGSRVRVVRAEAVALLGRTSRSRSGATRRSGRAAGRQARDHHRGVQRDRPRLGDRGRRTRCDGIRAGPQRRSARRPRRRDPCRRWQAYAFTCDVTDSTSVEATVKDILGQFGHVDYLVNNAGRSIRRSIIGLHRPAARLRTGDGGQLLRRGPDGARAAAALARTPVRPRGQRVQRRRAGRSPKYSAYLPTQGRARRVLRRGGDRDAVRPHHVHQHPHATGADADDRAVTAAQPDVPRSPRNTPRRWWCAA